MELYLMKNINNITNCMESQEVKVKNREVRKWIINNITEKICFKIR